MIDQINNNFKYKKTKKLKIKYNKKNLKFVKIFFKFRNEI